MEVKNNLITTIPFKGVQVRVEFTGGNSMKNIPAKFYTRDPFTQRALDSSDQLGRLYYLHQSIKEASDAQPATAAPAVETAGTVATGKAANAGKKAATTKKPATKTVSTPPAPEPPAEETASATATPGDGAPDAGEQDGDKLEFENLAEAVNYIATKYGEQVESESQVRKFIEEKEGKKCLIHKG